MTTEEKLLFINSFSALAYRTVCTLYVIDDPKGFEIAFIAQEVSKFVKFDDNSSNRVRPTLDSDGNGITINPACSFVGAWYMLMALVNKIIRGERLVTPLFQRVIAKAYRNCSAKAEQLYALANVDNSVRQSAGRGICAFPKDNVFGKNVTLPTDDEKMASFSATMQLRDLTDTDWLYLGYIYSDMSDQWKNSFNELCTKSGAAKFCLL